jgi:hypothetical protein
MHVDPRLALQGYHHVGGASKALLASAAFLVGRPLNMVDGNKGEESAARLPA